jgi:hypothetical protein
MFTLVGEKASMSKVYTLWSLLGLVLGVGMGYGVSLASFRAAGEYFAPNNSERPGLSSTAAPEPTVEVRRPRVLVVNGERYNFGVMHRDSRNSHVFLLKNVGDAPLTLEKGETTCKCTFSELAAREIAPNETVEVTLEWEGKSSTPMFSQTAEIQTNDPERGIVRLTIEGSLEDAVRAMPDTIYLPNLPGDTQTERTVRLYATEGEEPLRLEHFEFLREESAPFYHVEARPMSAEEWSGNPRVTSGLELTVSILPGLPTGKIDQTLFVALNSPARPDLEIPIKGNVISDISVVGRGTSFDTARNLLAIGAIPRAEGAKRELIVMIKGARRNEIELEIERVDPPEALRATLGEPTTSDRLVRYPLTVEVIPGAPPMSRLGNEQGKTAKIFLKATNSATKEMIIHVTFVTN